ncbi:MAG: FAD-binding protein [Bacillota bacterium]|nr:MAG: FAD-binding protein [Bacillota bacterium]
MSGEREALVLEVLRTDVVVIGAGLAALSSSAAARRSGSHVLLVCEPRAASASALSGGGFRAPADGYPPEQFFLDIVSCGGLLSQRSLAKAMATDAGIVRPFLEEAGLKVSDGARPGLFRVDSGSEPPGEALVAAVSRLVQDAGVETVPGLGWELLLDAGGAVIGFLAYDAARAEWFVVEAPSVVLATGGAAGVYLRTDNSPDASGDGMAMAFRAGAVLADMEFVQFWPVCRLSDGTCECLQPSSLAGSSLEAGDGKNVTAEVNLPGLTAGTASSSQSARLIYERIGLGPDGAGEEIPLRLSSAGGSEAGSGARSEETPTGDVVPAAHHTMGGVVCGDHGQTRVPGLFVAGEVAAGMHGAERLSGTGLTEAVVTGHRAGTLAAGMASRGSGGSAGSDALSRAARDAVGRTVAQLESGADHPTPADAALRIRRAMWHSAALVRTRESLDTAQSELNKIKRAMPLAVDTSDGPDVRAGLKTLNLLLVAEAIARSARYRRESRGVHYRRDYPERDDAEWLRHVRVRLLSGEISLDISQGLELMEP